MNKSFVKIILTALFLVLMTVNMTVLQLGLILNRTVFNPSFYDEVLYELHFYDQVRQWILQRLSTELPHGREGLAYFEKALTDVWLRQEFILILDKLSLFLNGKTEELPTLRIYKFKEVVMEHMHEHGDDQNKEKILDFWLGPLPHVARLQDITSVAFLHNARNAIALCKNVLSISIILGFTFFMVLFVNVRHLRETLLWFSASLFASGLLSFGFAFVVGWLINSITLIQLTQNSMIASGFHQDNVRAMFDSFTYAIVSFLKTVSLVSASAGFLSVCFVPFDTKNF